MSEDRQPLLIVWADAHAGPEQWSSLNEIEDDGEYLVHSIGWLLVTGEGGKDRHVSIAQSWTPTDDVDHVIHIPLGMVRSMSVLHPKTQDLTLTHPPDTVNI